MNAESLGKEKTQSTKESAIARTLPSGKSILNESEAFESFTKKDSTLKSERPTPSILNARSNAESSGLDETENAQDQLGTPGAPEIGQNKTPESTLGAADETQLMESHSSFPSLREGPSDLESLLEDSAKHLHLLMKGMFTQSEIERAKADCHTFDQHRVATAATVARQIVNVVRAGLDMAKTRVKVEQLKNKSL